MKIFDASKVDPCLALLAAEKAHPEPGNTFIRVTDSEWKVYEAGEVVPELVLTKEQEQERKALELFVDVAAAAEAKRQEALLAKCVAIVKDVDAGKRAMPTSAELATIAQ